MLRVEKALRTVLICVFSLFKAAAAVVPFPVAEMVTWTMSGVKDTCPLPITVKVFAVHW